MFTNLEHTEIFGYAGGEPQFGSADLISIMGTFAGPDMEDTKINSGNLRLERLYCGGAYKVVGRWPISRSTLWS